MEAAYFETSPSLEGGSGYGHSELDTSNFFGAPTTHQQQPALAADELWQARESPCKHDCLLRGMAGYVCLRQNVMTKHSVDCVTCLHRQAR